MDFGEVLVEARKKQGLSQKDLASMLVKEDGRHISPQYLHDIEKGRRNPPPANLMYQLSQYLKLPADYLAFAAGQLPADLRDGHFDPAEVERAFEQLRATLMGETGVRKR